MVSVALLECCITQTDVCLFYICSYIYMYIYIYMQLYIYMVCLRVNNCQFAGQSFVQKHGTAMGPKNACSYADLAMGIIDEKAKFEGSLRPMLWWRYRDDIFDLWTQGLPKLLEFTDIARNRGHFAPVINCQRNLIFKMADKDYRSQGKRVPYDILNNLSSVDLFYEEKARKKHLPRKF